MVVDPIVPGQPDDLSGVYTWLFNSINPLKKILLFDLYKEYHILWLDFFPKANIMWLNFFPETDICALISIENTMFAAARWIDIVFVTSFPGFPQRIQNVQAAALSKGYETQIEL